MPSTDSTARRRPAHARAVKTATKNPDRVRERRDRLINAAIAVFIEKGFHNATVRDIGRVADMTQGTIYNYVSSKDDILYLVCDRIVAEYNDETRRALDTTHDPVGRVRSAVRAISEVMMRHRREIRLIYQDSHLLDPRSRRVILARDSASRAENSCCWACSTSCWVAVPFRFSA
jgi:AcrR family transcriptional regulator